MALIPTMNDEEQLDVGETDAFDTGKRLLDQVNELKTVAGNIYGTLCSTLSKTSLSEITPDDIKATNKLNKKQLGEFLLTLLKSCQPICHETNIDLVINPPIEAAHKALLSDLTRSMHETVGTLAELQEKRFQGIQEQIAQLQVQPYSDPPNAPQRHMQPPHTPTTYVSNHHRRTGMEDTNSMQPPHTPTTSVSDLNILHAYDEYIPEFISSDLATKISDMLNNCTQFEQNTESGHSVMTYGHPYHYVGSKNPVTSPTTDLPGPLCDVVTLLQEKLPNCPEINSCLVNRYCGTEAHLPKHADDEFSIDPTSSIFTVSIGSTATVKFSNQHNSSSKELTVEPNSVYAMSRASQQLWKHEICKGAIQSPEVRYSLTFRHVSQRFLKSTIVLGDSNTKKLQFGTGKGTFGQHIPGKREKTLFINDINPLACCGYKNIIVHCGINSIKHYRVNNREKIEEHFDTLKSKLEQIMILCPNSNLIVAPILPTKTIAWNARGLHFNKCLFDFEYLCKGKFSTLNYSVFADPHTGFLRSDLGSYWFPDDPLHLGASGIRSLIGLIREKVLSSKISSHKKFSAVLAGHSAHTLGTDHAATLPTPPGSVAS
jgi:alkylated DNA repair dioxygenase AlkB